jgi:hypothetical protein
MDDHSWRELREGWERLRWARLRKFETAQAAAESMGMKPNTYTAYERSPDSSKHTRLDDQAAIRFARKFGVRWEWLLTGEGSPVAPEPEPTEPIKRVTDGMKVLPLHHQEAIADAIEALIKTRQ